MKPGSAGTTMGQANERQFTSEVCISQIEQANGIPAVLENLATVSGITAWLSALFPNLCGKRTSTRLRSTKSS